MIIKVNCTIETGAQLYKAVVAKKIKILKKRIIYMLYFWKQPRIIEAEDCLQH